MHMNICILKKKLPPQAQCVCDNTLRTAHRLSVILISWHSCMQFETATTDALSLFCALFCGSWRLQARHEALRLFCWQPELWHWWYTVVQMFTWLKLCHRGTDRGEWKTRLTRHDPGNEHAHVGAQGARPEQTQGAVGLSGGASNKQRSLCH